VSPDGDPAALRRPLGAGADRDLLRRLRPGPRARAAGAGARDDREPRRGDPLDRARARAPPSAAPRAPRSSMARAARRSSATPTTACRPMERPPQMRRADILARIDELIEQKRLAHHRRPRAPCSRCRPPPSPRELPRRGPGLRRGVQPPGDPGQGPTVGMGPKWCAWAPTARMRADWDGRRRRASRPRCSMRPTSATTAYCATACSATGSTRASPDLIVLAGFMEILSPEFMRPLSRAGSSTFTRRFLPAFRGIPGDREGGRLWGARDGRGRSTSSTREWTAGPIILQTGVRPSVFCGA